MDETKSNMPNHNNELLIKGYESAIALIQYNTGLLWQEFNAFFLAETVLLGFIGTAIAGKDPTLSRNILITIGSILGLLLCIPWFSTFHHNYTYYLLRIEQAKNYEAKLGIGLIIEGGKLSKGQPFYINDEKIQFPRLANRLPPRRAVPLLIGLFAAAFLLLAFFAWIP